MIIQLKYLIKRLIELVPYLKWVQQYQNHRLYVLKSVNGIACVLKFLNPSMRMFSCAVVTKSFTHSPDVVFRVVVRGGASVVVKECHVADTAGLGAPATTH